jgi:hypothetical protein
MKVRELIQELLERNDLEDEIFAMFWDKKYFTEELGLDNIQDNLCGEPQEPITEIEFDNAWSKIVANGENWLVDLADRPDFYVDVMELVCDVVTGERENNE